MKRASCLNAFVAVRDAARLRVLRHGPRYVERLSRNQQGDTYIELLIALVIIAFAVVAILGALTTSITNSAEHRSLSVDETLVKSYLETAKKVIELQPSPVFLPCQSASAYDSSVMAAFGSGNVPSGYSVAITDVEYWNSSTSSFSAPPCTPNNRDEGTQLVTATAWNNSSSMNLSTIVRDPCYESASGARTTC
jgi:type II secretory pathway pseudopilin PulG